MEGIAGRSRNHGRHSSRESRSTGICDVKSNAKFHDGLVTEKRREPESNMFTADPLLNISSPSSSLLSAVVGMSGDNKGRVG